MLNSTVLSVVTVNLTFFEIANVWMIMPSYVEAELDVVYMHTVKF